MPNTISGCYYSKLHVYPENWETGPKSLLKKTWRIDYYFYDPNFSDKYPNGKPIRIKSGINYEKTIEGRRAALKLVLNAELLLLEQQDYNPITKTKQAPKSTTNTAKIIHSGLPLLEALVAARNVKKCSPEWKLNLDSIIRWVEVAVKQLSFETIKISDVTRKHIKLIFDQLAIIKKDKWTNTNFNNYRKVLSSLWDELDEYEAVESNPVIRLRKLPEIQNKRLVLTEQERQLIDSTLRNENYRFWLVVNIFFHSGNRRTELINLKGKDVDLKNQIYKATVNKGSRIKIVERPIKDIAVTFWEQMTVQCDPEQYIFSVGLKPGMRKIRPEQLTRRWNRHVKLRLGINADLYSLKHSNTDEITDILGIEAAAKLNSHSSTKITLQHYAVNENERQMERIKKVGNTFSKGQAIDLSSLP